MSENKSVFNWTFCQLLTEKTNCTELTSFQVDVEFINENETNNKRKETVLSVNCSPNHHRNSQEQIL
jgi:hypothetical protein